MTFGGSMPYLQWTEELRVGIRDVDEQHQGLVRIINDLHDAMTQGRGKDILGPTIQKLIDYTVTHFSTEEQLFAAHGYPDAPEHLRQHAEFVEKVADFKQGFDEDRLLLSLDVMNFLGDWLVDHIQVRDKAFGPFLAERGVA